MPISECYSSCLPSRLSQDCCPDSLPFRLNLVKAIQSGDNRATGRRSSRALRNVLVVSQVAICVVLLIGAGLLIRTFMNLRGVELGFNPNQVLTAQMALSGGQYEGATQVLNFYDQGLLQIGGLPGVATAAICNNLPVERGLNLPIHVPPQQGGASVTSIDWRYVTPNYFEVLHIPLVKGRQIISSDSGLSAAVALVNEQFKRQFFPDQEVIGQTIRMYDKVPLELRDRARQIVGVVADVKGRGLSSPAVSTMHVPVAQLPAGLMKMIHQGQVNWLIRTENGGPGIAAIRQTLQKLDPL